MKKQLISTLSIGLLLSAPHTVKAVGQELQLLIEQEAEILDQSKEIKLLQTLIKKNKDAKKKALLKGGKQAEQCNAATFASSLNTTLMEHDNIVAQSEKELASLRSEQAQKIALQSRIAHLKPAAEFTITQQLEELLPKIRTDKSLKRVDTTTTKSIDLLPYELLMVNLRTKQSLKHVETTTTKSIDLLPYELLMASLGTKQSLKHVDTREKTIEQIYAAEKAFSRIAPLLPEIAKIHVLKKTETRELDFTTRYNALLNTDTDSSDISDDGVIVDHEKNNNNNNNANPNPNTQSGWFRDLFGF